MNSRRSIGKADHPHPLATAVASIAVDTPALVVGIGSGRNLPVLLESGRLIFAVDESETLISSFAERKEMNLIVKRMRNGVLPLPDASIGVLVATHVLQHGTRQTVRAMLDEFARVCMPGAAAALVFASTADARCGQGTRIEAQCFAPDAGDEQGVLHLYLTDAQIRELLAPQFRITSLEHVDADAIAGSWAHRSPRGLRHFFVSATRDSTSVTQQSPPSLLRRPSQEGV